MAITIVFENKFFLIADKPNGWLTVPSRLGAEDSRFCLSRFLIESTNQSLLPVHRLDQEVSGIVLFAKTAEAHREANAWFEGRMIRKTYEALSEENLEQYPGRTIEKVPESIQIGQKFEWKCLLARGKKRAFESPRGKPSLTQAVWLGKSSFNSRPAHYWKLFPLTGRSHQLRYELYRHGHSILGDELYGSKTSFKEDAIALRATELDLSGCRDRERFELPQIIKVEGLVE